MTEFLRLIVQYPADTGLVFFVLVVCGFLFVTKQYLALTRAALYLVSVAEEEWGDQTGAIKFAHVAFTLRTHFKLLTFLLTDEQLSKIIETALKKMKAILSEKEKELS